jgi:hypothetical protein
MQLIDRHGNQLKSETGTFHFTVGTDKGKVDYSRNGNVVTYMLEITVSSSGGNRYEFSELLPYYHPRSIAVITGFVGTSLVVTGGSMIIRGKELIFNFPKYGSEVTFLASITATIE